MSGQFLNALRGSHQALVRCDAYRAGGSELIARDLPVSGGSVTVDISSQVRRSLRISIADPTLEPGVNPAAVLTPYGSELAVYRGVQFLDGSVEWCPLGVFRVDEASTSVRPGVIEVAGPDRSRAVAEGKFFAPTASFPNNTVVEEITRHVVRVLPNVTVLDEIGATEMTPRVTWEQERWDAIEELAASIGADVAFNVAGQFVIRPVPGIDDPIVWQAGAGESGVLIEGERSTSRENTYNGIVASGERTDDTPPVWSSVLDEDPRSPTRWGGPFGKVPKFYSSPLLDTLARCILTGRAMLKWTKALNRQLTLSTVVNPALDAGDVISVRFPDGTVERHIVDSFEIPLDAGTAMQITTRSSNPGGDDDSA